MNNKEFEELSNTPIGKMSYLYIEEYVRERIKRDVYELAYLNGNIDGKRGEWEPEYKDGKKIEG